MICERLELRASAKTMLINTGPREKGSKNKAPHNELDFMTSNTNPMITIVALIINAGD